MRRSRYEIPFMFTWLSSVAVSGAYKVPDMLKLQEKTEARLLRVMENGIGGFMKYLLIAMLLVASSAWGFVDELSSKEQALLEDGYMPGKIRSYDYDIDVVVIEIPWHKDTSLWHSSVVSTTTVYTYNVCFDGICLEGDEAREKHRELLHNQHINAKHERARKVAEGKK